jgi:hypothetical protein
MEYEQAVFKRSLELAKNRNFVSVLEYGLKSLITIAQYT